VLVQSGKAEKGLTMHRSINLVGLHSEEFGTKDVLAVIKHRRNTRIDHFMQPAAIR